MAENLFQKVAYWATVYRTGTSFSVNFFWKMLCLWKELLLLSITNLIPDFYQVATLPDKNHDFFLQSYFRIGVLTVFFVSKSWHEIGHEEIYEDQCLSATK